MQPDQILALSEPLRDQLLVNANAVATLVNELHITLTELLAFSAPLREKLLLNSNHAVDFLKANLTPEEISALTLNRPLLIELVEHIYDAEALVNATPLSLADLVKYEATERAQLWNDANSIEQLTKGIPISYDELMNIKEPERTELFDNARDIVALVQEAHLSLADFLKFDAPMRAELLRDLEPILQIITSVPMPFEELWAINPLARAEFVGSPSLTVYLLTEEMIPFESLVQLPIEDLHAVIYDMNSKESQSILNSLRPKGPSQRPF
jgi:hypothetical protein